MRKIAILMISLGPKVAGQVMKRLPEDMIDRITAEISEVNLIAAEDKSEAVDDFVEIRRRAAGVEFGGENSAMEILEEARGKRDADNVLKRGTGDGDQEGFDNLEKVDALTVTNYLKNEHPQTIALVLSHVAPRVGGPIMELMPPSLQGGIAHRMAVLENPDREALEIVESIVGNAVQGERSNESREFGGSKRVAALLNEIDQETCLEIIEDMREIDDECAEEIENLMFVFEDLADLDGHCIREVLEEVKGEELALALKGTPQDIREKIFRNMSKSAGAGIREDLESMGPAPLQDVEEAQQKMVSVVQRLMDEGIIVPGKGGAGACMVT